MQRAFWETHWKLSPKPLGGVAQQALQDRDVELRQCYTQVLTSVNAFSASIFHVMLFHTSNRPRGCKNNMPVLKRSLELKIKEAHPNKEPTRAIQIDAAKTSIVSRFQVHGITNQLVPVFSHRISGGRLRS